MTERKPPGVPFESWVDRQIREAMERGEFDDLPGAGKPLPGLDRPHDDMWWIKQKVESEGLTMPLPPTLALRKEAEEALAQARGARTESEARQIIEDVNRKIRKAIRTGLSGPPLNLMPFDVEQIVSEWRRAQ
ncbi:J-domain-containing protein [Nonomuraea sp. 3N208]|uniref:J-domain-containing protein n=1 Tax=Nonomuraea sp. 3N208 TaxID=3457421 RepID=UPI003FCC65B5